MLQNLLWGLSLLAALAGVVGAVVLFLRYRKRLGWNRTFRDAMLVVVAASVVALLAPSSDGVGGPAEALLAAVYNFMQMVSIQLDTGGIAEVAKGTLPPLAATLYNSLLLVLAIVVPALVVSTALLELRRWYVRYRVVVHSRSRKAVYVFSGISDNEVTLARDILAHPEHSGSPQAGHLGPRKPEAEHQRPLVVFCGITEEVRDEVSATIGDLQDRWRDDVVFTPYAPLDMTGDLARFASIHCFLFSPSRDRNVVDATALYDRIALLAAQCASEEEAVALARRFHLYCLHDDENDELVFDTVAHREVDNLGDANPAFARAAKNAMEVRLFSDIEERVYGLLSGHPLFTAFERATLYALDECEQDGKPRTVLKPLEESQASGGAQAAQDDCAGDNGVRHLLVVVVGLGRFGLEALKAAYWFGRMRGVSLHVLGIDRIADDIERQLKTSCPLMLDERDSYDHKPVVRLVKAEAGTPEFEEALKPETPGTCIYAIVTLGNDRLNLDTALSMRRSWERMRLGTEVQWDGSYQSFVDERCLPVICPLIYSEETSEAAMSMVTERDERYMLTPFGCADEVYRFDTIVDSPWERRAIAMNAAYDECWATEGRGMSCTMPFDQTLANYNKYEIKKLSNRTCTRHIPYRLWSVGIDPSLYLDERGELLRPLPQQLWYEKLGVTADEVDALFGDAFDGSETRGDAWGALMRVRRRYPLLCELADIEHVRWAAFYASHGWRDLTIPECLRLMRLGVIAKTSEHQTALMRMHCYLCDVDTLIERGVALGEDPFRYDRAAILEIPRILSGEIFG